jgi:AraC-like DNA-binding protein
MDTQPATNTDVERMDALRQELIGRLTRILTEDGHAEPVAGVHLIRRSVLPPPVHAVSSRRFCVIAQGSKTIMLGNEMHRYDPEHYLITTAEMPTVAQITDASPEEPYLGIVMDLDPALVSSVMVETGHAATDAQSSVKALDVSPLDADLFETVVRLVRLADDPRDARFLAPLIMRELVYRLLLGEQGGRLRQLTSIGGSTHRIATAIDRIRTDFDKPLRIEDVARDIGMSPSSLHQHFKTVTAMSPLQFQKQLRMQEARRLLLVEDLDAASAGFRVGYDDASYFNREYKKFFGEPPIRNVERLRESIPAGAALLSVD